MEYEIEMRIIGALRDGHDGDVLNLTTLLHDVLIPQFVFCGASVLFLERPGAGVSRAEKLEIAIDMKGGETIQYDTEDHLQLPSSMPSISSRQRIRR